MATDAQIAANQKNAQLSTGPKTPETKSKTSLNAVKTGLTGRTVLLPGDDAELYEAHVAHFFARHRPAGEAEQNVVQSLADAEWRLQRIPSLEMGIYALGHLEFADQFPTEEPEVRKHLIQAKVYLAYERQLKNLSLQESRLRRQRQKDEVALRELQDRRREAERRERLDRAACCYIEAVHEGTNQNFDLAPFGFEFSIDEIEIRAIDIKPDLFAEYERERAAKLKCA